MNDDFRHVISENSRGSELLNMAKANGMKSLLDDGLAKVRHGETTLDEILRVLGPQIRHERVCEKCRKIIDAKFLFCPYCGQFRRDICEKCKMPLEDDWINCALCGDKRSRTL
jgi:RNA polymerase subunit RPABC4/transcription elongation factor Spt4